MTMFGKVRWTLAAALLAFAVSPAFAQSCAMCTANARATPKEGQRALNRAIFVLLAPPVSIMLFGFGYAIRYGKRRDRENGNLE